MFWTFYYERKNSHLGLTETMAIVSNMLSETRRALGLLFRTPLGQSQKVLPHRESSNDVNDPDTGYIRLRTLTVFGHFSLLLILAYLHTLLFIYLPNFLGSLLILIVKFIDHLWGLIKGKGPSIKYVTLCLANFYPPSPCDTL